MKGRHSTHLLDLRDAHSALGRGTLNVNTFVYGGKHLRAECDDTCHHLEEVAVEKPFFEARYRH